MPRPAWSLHAYQLIEPDEQLDLFACREIRLHIVERQLELSGHADRTLCGGLLPAMPRWRSMARAALHDRRLCAHCKATLQLHRRGGRPEWPMA